MHDKKTLMQAQHLRAKLKSRGAIVRMSLQEKLAETIYYHQGEIITQFFARGQVGKASR
ncbi:MAG: hypothetical protein NTX50_18140 [Candidatus Sumerlaeota bacterium]|nr:hypothetical protein [Candidatus Sumerlaeota bacterium]